MRTNQSKRTKRVDLIIAGVQKAGTTALFKLLGSHSDIAPSSQKETHFFEDEHVDWTAPDYGRYHSFFELADPEQIWFEATPSYLIWPSALDRIAAYNPDVRLILSFRDPIERAYSHWRMQRERGTEPLSFGEAIRVGRRRVNRSGSFDRDWRRYSYVERGLYAEQVSRVLMRFRTDQIKFVSAHDLLRDQDTTLAAITDWLRIAPLRAMPLRENARSDDSPAYIDLEDIQYLRAVFRKDMADFGALTGLRISDWLTMRDDSAGWSTMLPDCRQR
jgi:hypothetical protein